MDIIVKTNSIKNEIFYTAYNNKQITIVNR